MRPTTSCIERSGLTSTRWRDEGERGAICGLGGVEWQRVEKLLRGQWSPEQIAGYFRETGEMAVSHETIYQHVWRDRAAGGRLHEHLRGARKQRRKRSGRYDSRGRLAGKRVIGERPRSVEERRWIGHWEIDTVHGRGRASVVTLVERKTGYVAIGKLAAATVLETNAATLALMRRQRGRVRTITADKAGVSSTGMGSSKKPPE